MHNLPSNNETNIIRNIFDISTNFLNEQVVKTFDDKEAAKAIRNAPGLGKDASGKFRPTADVRQQILMTPTTQVPQPRRGGVAPAAAAPAAPAPAAAAPAAKPSSGLMGGAKPGSDFGGNRGIIRNAAGEIVGVETGLVGKAGKGLPGVAKSAAGALLKPGLVRGIGLEVGADLGLKALGMKGGAGQVQTGRGMQPVESPGALDYARDAVASLAGGVGIGGKVGVAGSLPFVGWNAGRAIAKQMGVDQEDRNILELGAEALGTSGSQHGRSQQLEKEAEAGEAARQARASDPEFLKKQAADKAARQAAAEEEKAAAAKPAAPAKEFALPASTLKPTENPLAGAASAKSAPAKPAAPVQTPAPASTRTPIMPGSSKEVIKAATSNPTADILKTIQGILTAPSAAPAKPATSGKLPEQPMDRAVKQFKNSQEEQKGAQPLPEPAKGAYESGKEVPEAEWKARQAKAQATYNDARAIKAGYKDYAQYQQMQDESAGLKKTAEAQQARLAELKKQNLVSESYYYRRLANLFEETSDQSISGVNPAAYGYTPKGQRKARLAAKGFAEPMRSWAGDSTTEAPDLEPESTERPHIDTVVAPHISTLIAAADKAQIDLGHGEAFNPLSRDHQRLIKTSKDPAVLKASQAIGQIRKDYGVED